MPRQKDKEALRQIVRTHLAEIVRAMNATLRGRQLSKIEPVLKRLGRGNRLPHWFAKLAEDGTLPNLDGKTIGSVIEMLFTALIEVRYFAGRGVGPLRINPASGVDLPDLDLGIKSPSENYCTSEPFFSAYERLIGSEFDIAALLTDYQTAKLHPPLRLQIIKSVYLSKTEIADRKLCRIARQVREWLLAENETWAKKVFRFLAYVNQQDWLGKQILGLIELLPDEKAVENRIPKCSRDLDKYNADQLDRNRVPLPEEVRAALRHILDVRPIRLGVIDAADSWVVETHKETARTPTESEWHRLISGPLDGKIGMSFALQWRYNFGHLFNNDDECPSQENGGDLSS
jgi:hypothetical protein